MSSKRFRNKSLVSKDLITDSIQVFITRNIYPECKEGFVVTEGNGGFESVLA